jgi:hypothetical protein
MVKDNHHRDDVPPTTDPPEPPFPVADVPKRLLPVETFSESRLYALEQNADKLVTDGGCDSLDGTVRGLLGDNSFSRVLPIKAEPDTTVRENGDGGHDFRFNGNTFNVKTVGRHRDDPELTVSTRGQLKADFYVLAHRIGATSCRLLGYAPRATVKASPRFFHHGEPYRLVEQDRLWPFPQFLSGN